MLNGTKGTKEQRWGPWGLDNGLRRQIRALPDAPGAGIVLIGVAKVRTHVPCTAHTRQDMTRVWGMTKGEGWKGCVVSSDHRWPWAVVPGLAQHPQAVGQTHNPICDNTCGRLGPGDQRVDFVWISA